MEILIWVITCTFLHDNSLVQSIINVQSSGYQYYIGDSSQTITASYPDDLSAAKKLLSSMHKKGARPLIGLLGVPSELAAKYGRTPDELFDPCVNISVGTAILSELATTCRGGKYFRSDLLKKYSALLGYNDDFFVNQVLGNIELMELKKRRYRTMTGDHASDQTKLLEQNKALLKDKTGWQNTAIFLEDRAFVGEKPPLKTEGQ